MSSRTLGERYGGIGTGSGIRSYPSAGGTTLLDLLSGNTPSKLMEKQYGFEKDMAETLQRHHMEELQLAAKIAKDKDFRDAFLKSAPPGAFDAEGKPTKVYDEFLNNTALQMVRNASQQAKLEGIALDTEKNPDIQGAANFGTNLRATGLKPEDIFKTTPGLGATPLPNIAGVTGNKGSPFGLNTVTGGTPGGQQAVTDSFGLMHMLNAPSIPGRINPGLPPVDPNLRKSIMSGGAEDTSVNNGPLNFGGLGQSTDMHNPASGQLSIGGSNVPQLKSIPTQQDIMSQGGIGELLRKLFSSPLSVSGY